MRPLCAVCVAALVAGCSPVREDRRINFSADGNNVGFQHGKNGVFVADGDGGGLTKIFSPSDDTIATSSPLFSPADKRLIFTTAKALDGKARTATLGDPRDPAGAAYAQIPVTYTCWLRGEKDGDRPEELFSARCDHVGYVAANLAVRWHPKGDRVLFLDNTADPLHGVFAFDLATKKKSPVFPHRSGAVIFDWAPDNEHLVCVRWSGMKDAEGSGIWVGMPGADGWWHVPGSEALAGGELLSTIEQLRATRPAWSRDGRFAFASHEPRKEVGGKEVHRLRVADLAKRTVKKLAESDRPFRGPHWSPDGRLGVVHDGALRIAEGGKLGPALKTRPVRDFAGWSADGKRLAYVAHDFDAKQAEEWNALLFVPDPLARDVIVLADGAADSPGREALSGVRVTFPHWSPKEERLSFWGTFTPSYRSWPGAALESGLRPGDPAAVIDPSTGDLRWMPVNAAEKAQVGHYHLLKGDHAEAWRWYERARRDDTKAEKGMRLSPRDDFSFFESYCLAKLGRHEEARERLAHFRETFAPSFSNDPAFLLWVTLRSGDVERWRAGLASPKALSGQLLRDLYQGEVLLSLGVAADAEAHFREQLRLAKSDEERLSRAVLLAQMLLARKKWREYVRVTAASILPAAVKRYDGRDLDNFLEDLDGAAVQQVALAATAGVTLLPLIHPDVLSGCDEGDLKACLPHLEQLADKAKGSLMRRYSHMTLYAVARKLGREKERLNALEVVGKGGDELSDEAFAKQSRELMAALRESTLGLLRMTQGR
jgi:tetratricopeptide (TPR) repeat protein